jgi:D-arginine dehydrogenase
VLTEDGPVEADAVVLAAGAWAGALGGRALVPLRRTVVQTAPHPASSTDHPWVWVDDEGVYARPEAGGWLVSGCDEAVDPPADRAGSQGPVEALPRALALDKLARWLPALADAVPVGGWSGLRTFAPDRRPLLGPDPAAPGLHWAAGLGGFGLTCSLAVGEAVAAWVVGEAVPWLDAAAVSPGRPLPRRLPIRPTGTLHGAKLIDVAR